jgi:hypothetical protein
MVFFKRREHGEGPGMREVAAAVSRDEICPHGFEKGTCAICMGIPESPLPRPAAAPAPQPRPEAPLLPHFKGPEGTHAPLFVKIERYKEVLETAQEIKSFVRSIRQIFGVIQDMESARDEAVKLLKVSVDRLEQSMQEIDAELVKPIGFEPFPHGEAELHHLEESLTTLQRNISSLRREVEGFRAK